MKSPQDIALQRAQDFARDRGWRQEPLTWEEVEVLVGLTFGPDLEDWDAGYDEDFETGYDEGFKAGRAAGYERGYQDGKEIGFALAEKAEAAS